MVSKAVIVGIFAVIVILCVGSFAYIYTNPNPNPGGPTPTPDPWNPTPTPTYNWPTPPPTTQPTNSPNAPTVTMSLASSNPTSIQIAATDNGYGPYTYIVFVDTVVYGSGTMSGSTISVEFSPALASGQHSIYVKVTDTLSHSGFSTPQVVQVTGSTTPTPPPTGNPTPTPTAQPNTAFMYQAVLITYTDGTTQWYIPSANQYTILPQLSIYTDLQTNKQVQRIGAYLYWGIQGDNKAIRSAAVTFDTRLCIYANDQTTPVKDYGWMGSNTVAFPNQAYQSLQTNTAYQATGASTDISMFNSYLSTGQYYYIVTIRNLMIQTIWNDNTASTFQFSGQGVHDIRWHFSYLYSTYSIANTLGITQGWVLNVAAEPTNIFYIAVPAIIVIVALALIAYYLIRKYKK